MAVIGTILARHSARSFQNRDIPNAILEELLLTAQAAPSGGNGRTCVFGIVRKQSFKTAPARRQGVKCGLQKRPSSLPAAVRIPG